MKNSNKHIDDDVLVKYLLGEADSEEQMAVEQWKAADVANQKHYNDMKLIWEESKKLEGQTTVSTEDAWQRLMQRVEQDENSETATQPSRTIQFSPARWMRAAALLLAMVGSAWLIYLLSGAGNEQMLAQSFDKVLITTLPDGSVVTLNKNSELSYPTHFDGDKRNVTLKGEAFFSITANKAKPFVIDAGNSSVTVVGTTFNVKSKNDVTEVIVESGIVEVAKREKAVRLLPGQKVVVSATTDTPMSENVTDELYNYYRTNEFVCNGTPLSKVVATLNEAYNTQIVLHNSKIASLPLSVTFHNEPIEVVVDIIAKTLNLSVEKQGDQIILKER